MSNETEPIVHATDFSHYYQIGCEGNITELGLHNNTELGLHNNTESTHDDLIADDSGLIQGCDEYHWTTAGVKRLMETYSAALYGNPSVGDLLSDAQKKQVHDLAGSLQAGFFSCEATKSSHVADLPALPAA